LMEVANGAAGAPNSGAIREEARCFFGRADDLQGLRALEVAEQGRIELHDGSGMGAGFGRGHLLDARLDAAFTARPRPALQGALQLAELSPDGDRKVGVIEIAELAEGADQALLERTVADECPDGFRETLGEIRHSCAFVLVPRRRSTSSSRIAAPLGARI